MRAKGPKHTLPKRCYDCLYCGRSTDSCDYYFLLGVGNRNPGKAKDCDKFVLGKRMGKLPDTIAVMGKDKRSPGYYNVTFYQAIRSLYNDGKNDVEIAEELKCSPSAVARWRREHFLPSQKELKGRNNK